MLLQSQNYNNCIRTEKGYCRIQWKENSATSPDPYYVGTGAAIDATACPDFTLIPGLSPDGILPIAVPSGAVAYQNEMCGNAFGVEGGATQALVSQQTPFILGLHTGTTDF